MGDFTENVSGRAALSEEQAEAARYAVPEGFEIVSDDVSGYYDHTLGEIFFIPHSVTLMDSGIDEVKSSALLVGTLVRPATLLVSADDDDEDGEGEITRQVEEVAAGETVGIWLKPGQRKLLDMEGHTVWMAPNGRRKMKTKGHNRMWKFKIASTKVNGEFLPPSRLKLAEDRRKSSRMEPIHEERRGRDVPWWLKILPDSGMGEARRIAREQAARESVAIAAEASIS